jgi:hypothetical protein
MAKVKGTQTKLARLRLLTAEPVSPEMVQELRKALADPSNLVIAAAAALILSPVKAPIDASVT